MLSFLLFLSTNISPFYRYNPSSPIPRNDIDKKILTVTQQSGRFERFPVEPNDFGFIYRDARDWLAQYPGCRTPFKLLRKRSEKVTGTHFQLANLFFRR